MFQGWVKPDFTSSTELTASKVSKRNIPAPSKSLKVDDDKLWVNKHKAESVDELVVQKKKVAEVKQWLQEAINSKRKGPPMLLLVGPSGCGKYQTISLLCKELGISIHRWEEPIRYSSNAEWEFTSGMHREGPSDVNPLVHLAEFMSRSNRYSTLKLSSDASSSYSKKIVLVKDLPAMVFTNLDEWHGMIQNYFSKGKTPIVFVITEGNSNFGTSTKLFPTQLQQTVSLWTISLNPLANTFISKALQRVLAKERRSLPAQQRLEDVVEASNGDLRCAINTLQLLCADKSRSTSTARAPSAKKRKSTTDSAPAPGNNARDSSLDLMHALGKILYAKRRTGCEAVGQLPAHLVGETRTPLQEDVDALANKMADSSERVLLFVHQNYPAFYGRIEDAAGAAHYLSSAELMTAGVAHRQTLDEYLLLTSVRGVMHCNTEVIGSSWRPLKRPDWYGVQQKMRQVLTEARTLWPFTSDADFFPERLPFMKRMHHATAQCTPSQRMYLQKIGSFQGNWPNYSAAHAGETTIERAGDRSAEAKATDTAKVNNCTSTATGQVQEEEDFVIEDYDD